MTDTERQALEVECALAQRDYLVSGDKVLIALKNMREVLSALESYIEKTNLGGEDAVLVFTFLYAHRNAEKQISQWGFMLYDDDNRSTERPAEG